MDGANSLGAGSLAEALLPFIERALGVGAVAPAGEAERLWRAENALRNIETACNYSPHRDAGTWDAALAALIHQSARLLPAPGVTAPEPQTKPAQPLMFRHKRTGGLYELIGTARLQTDKPLFDLAEVVAYRGGDGRIWARAANEFDDRMERARP